MQTTLDLGTPYALSAPAAGFELADDEMIVDLFAGGGGSSTGIARALGESPDIAVNHWPAAIECHETNHPDTMHYCASVNALDPRDLVPAGKRVGLLFAAPDCRSFSRSRGAAPKSKSIRDLAWIVPHWIEMKRPRVICVENVAEFQDWGPLTLEGQAIKSQKGETFKEWVRTIRSHGYAIEWKVLNCADYNAPTTRRRLIIIARCDGLPIVWPEATHGRPGDSAVIAGEKQPWLTSGEQIDYSLPVYSIFLSREEAKVAGVRRPLAEKTLRRIAQGMFRHCLEADNPYLVAYQGSSVMPLTHHGDGDRTHALDEPFRTITAANRGELAYASPFFARTAHGDVDRNGKRRGRGDHALADPYPTITSSPDSALVCPQIAGSPYLVANNENNVPKSLSAPLSTVTGGNRHLYVAPTLIQTGYGERPGQAPRVPGLDKPLGTVVAGGQKHGLACAALTCFNQNAAGSTPADPFKTVIAGATRHAYIEGQISGDVDRSEEVTEFLWKYRELATKPVTRSRIGELMIGGVPMRIRDIGLRMISPAELFRASGFPEDYIHDRTASGRKLSKTEQVKLCGNAVPPPLVEAIISANVGPRRRRLAAAA